MGVIYSYYDSKNHSEFDMGKWYCWDDPIIKLFALSRDELIKEIELYVSQWDLSESEAKSYATWLAQKLIEFSQVTEPQFVSWVNNDSDDITFSCKKCGQYTSTNSKYNDCKCVEPHRAKYRSRYTDDYNSSGQFIGDGR